MYLPTQSTLKELSLGNTVKFKGLALSFIKPWRNESHWLDLVLYFSSKKIGCIFLSLHSSEGGFSQWWSYSAISECTENRKFLNVSIWHFGLVNMLNIYYVKINWWLHGKKHFVSLANTVYFPLKIPQNICKSCWIQHFLSILNININIENQFFLHCAVAIPILSLL